MSLSGQNLSLEASTITGDVNGLMTVRRSQSVHFKGEEHHLPFSFLSQQQTNIGLPNFMTCRGLEVIMKGTMDKMTNLTIGQDCRFLIKDSTETKFTLSNIVVQTDGYFAVERNDNKHVTFYGRSLDIRGGGSVSIFNRRCEFFFAY